ncbi:hypothetical protein CHELA40_13788 [Chelatococcus asaccharovorans]|nr:hypothetical protein CHELA40_13788 [Chelatococcus asaccharovorans]CAH1675628.1 hypothetical protein CHELA17_61838 [Chelatococcus asaccharovorans]
MEEASVLRALDDSYEGIKETTELHALINIFYLMASH